ncbi:MAG: IS3 family transposase [Oscillospiraceae bacterium]|nr:IS3 family transposase [Oscillospiraceae bacterium]
MCLKPWDYLNHYYELDRVDAVEVRNKGLINEIKKIFEHHKGRYGVRRIHREYVN